MAGDTYVLDTLDEGGSLGPLSFEDDVGLRWETGEYVPYVPTQAFTSGTNYRRAT